jgi:hypothetical protein
MARSDQTSWLIEVLEGPSAGFVLELVGRSMPYRAGAGGSVSFGGTQRSKLTFYAGNRTASQQIIGRTIDPTTINGAWKERYLGEDRPIDLVEVFEGLRDQGVQVRIFWQTIERIGIIKTFRWSPGDPVGGLGDIKWECTFEWRSTGEPPVPRVAGEVLTLRDDTMSAAASLATLGQFLEDLVQSVGSFAGQARVTFAATRRAIEDLVDELSQPLTTEAEAAARMSDEASMPASLVEDVSTAAGSALLIASEAAEIVSGIFPSATTVGDTLEDVIGGYLERVEVVDEAFRSMEDQFDLRLRLEEIIRPDAFAEVTAEPGTDLRELAIRYYGEADLWRRIAKQNGFESSVVPDDATLVIIPLNLPDATDERIGGRCS